MLVIPSSFEEGFVTTGAMSSPKKGPEGALEEGASASKRYPELKEGNACLEGKEILVKREGARYKHSEKVKRMRFLEPAPSRAQKAVDPSARWGKEHLKNGSH